MGRVVIEKLELDGMRGNVYVAWERQDSGLS